MLKPAIDDPNRKAELERMARDATSFGAAHEHQIGLKVEQLKKEAAKKGGTEKTE